MEPHGNGHPRNPEYCENLPPEHSEFRLRAWCDGAVLCETKLRRRNLPQGASCELIDDPDYRGMLYVPNNLSVSRTAQGPAVIVLSGSDGGIAKAQNIAQLLCGHGFAAMAVEYFGLEGLPDNLNAIPLEIVEKAAWFLARRNDVDSRRIGLYGRSKGAEMALAAAQRVPLIHAVVANSPSCQIMEGLRGALPSRSSSWTWRGEELPYRRFGIRDLADRLARRVTTAAQLTYDSPCAIVPKTLRRRC